MFQPIDQYMLKTRDERRSHLYWGTRTDNHQDAVEAGVWKSIHARTLEKHGAEAVRVLKSNAGRAGGRALRKSIPV